jgi:hypothetical protein
MPRTRRLKDDGCDGALLVLWRVLCCGFTRSRTRQFEATMVFLLLSAVAAVAVKSTTAVRTISQFHRRPETNFVVVVAVSGTHV